MSSITLPYARLTLGLALAAGAITLTGALQASADTLGAFTCTDKSGGVAGAAGTVYDVRVAHHDGYDRLVIGFPTANTMPQYQLTQQATAHFVRDASGQPVTLNGSAGLRVVLRNTDIVNGAPSDLKPSLPAIREVTRIGDFERVVSYGVGLATPACFRVLELSGPTRLVIDVQTPAAAPAATAAPSTAASQPATPSDLAATGHPAQPAQPVNFPVTALILGLLAVTAGLTIAGLRRFARK
ncbi:MAG TPA: hypothetical protein VGR77_00130 [Candidatus Dormibacteraeota bacterium]|nr:hypothetical protein [Candidatus Dormibacteraeota bacterium]